MTVTNTQLKTFIEGQATVTNSNFQKAKAAINNKVDKVSGKGLSANDFTNGLKTKLEGIETGAEVNDIVTVKVNGTALTPDANKAVNVQIPAAVAYTIGEAATTTSGMLKTYVLKADGVEVSGSKIDIPKDYLLKSATIEACATANSPISGLAVGDPYLDFVFNTKDNDTSTGNTHQYVSLKGLVDVYTAGTGINVSNANVISIDTTVVAQKSDLPDALSDLTDDLMTGYAKASAASAVGASDSVKVAIGKLEKAIDGKQASGSYAASSHTHTKSEITDFPTIPTNNNQLINGAGYQTAQNVTDAIDTIFGSISITAWDDITLS